MRDRRARAERAVRARPRERSRDLPQRLLEKANRARERVRGLGAKPPDQVASERSASEPRERAETCLSAFQLEASRASERIGSPRAKPSDQNWRIRAMQKVKRPLLLAGVLMRLYSTASSAFEEQASRSVE